MKLKVLKKSILAICCISIFPVQCLACNITNMSGNLIYQCENSNLSRLSRDHKNKIATEKLASIMKQKSKSADFNIELITSNKNVIFHMVPNASHGFNNGKKSWNIQSKNDPTKSYGTVEVQNSGGKPAFISFDLANKTCSRKYKFCNTENTLCIGKDFQTIIMRSESSLSLQQITMLVLHHFTNGLN